MRQSPLLLAAAIVVTTAACGSDSLSEPGPDPGGNSTLECESRGYPCSLSEVPIAVLERGDALRDEALAMLEAGGSTGDAAAWLEGQADVAEVEWDETAIWFRPEGGTGIWILRGAAFGSASLSGIAPADQSPRQSRLAHHVVGADGSERKKALVLSPFYWDFGDFDDGPSVAAILSGTRGYENGVTFQVNELESSANVDVNSFMGWGDYQVIHVATHGTRICRAGTCRAILVVGLLENLLPDGPGTKAEKLHGLGTRGLTLAEEEETRLEYFVLGADFFRHQYGDGLDDALVFLNACRSFGPQATDLVDAIQGNTSVVLGWTEFVLFPDAYAAGVALYRSLSEEGYPVKVAYDDLGELKTGAAVPGQNAPQLRLSERPAGGDLRIREVVTVLNPSSAETLSATDLVPIQGTQGDGEPDAAPFLVRVDGVKPELAGDMMVHVSIDGVESDPVPLADGQADDEGRWTVGGVVPLSYDLTEATPVTIRAWVNLHDGGESRHETGATLSGEEPIMGTVWEMEAVHTSGWTTASGVPNTPYTATAHLTLSFAPGQSAAEPHPRYIVTGGTVTFDYNHTYYNCTTTAPVLTFEVTEDVSLESELTFDTTVSPVRYSGLIYTQGPEFQVTTTCDETSTRTHRAANTWLLIESEDALPVSSDGRSITGTDRDETSVGSFIQVDYTITRTQ
ncbi:MAG: hypothetical protein ACAI18_02100 [Gemmatimonadales bacterium]